MEYWQVRVLIISVFMTTAVNIIHGAGSHDHSHDQGSHIHHHDVHIITQKYIVTVAVNNTSFTHTFENNTIRGNVFVLLNVSEYFNQRFSPGPNFPSTIYPDGYKGIQFVHYINGSKHHSWVIPRCQFKIVEKHLLYYFKDRIIPKNTMDMLLNIIKNCP